MKSKILILTVLSAAVLAVGCGKEKTTSEQIDALKAETKEAAQDLKDYTYAQKSEFTSTMQNSLAAINKDLDTLSEKIEKSTDAVQAEAKPKLAALREQAAKLNAQLDSVKDSTESTWDSVKAGTKNAFESFKDGVTATRQWISDKIAP
jgi:chromosome segregation ATPase